MMSTDNTRKKGSELMQTMDDNLDIPGLDGKRKKEKAKRKTICTKVRNKLFNVLDFDESVGMPSRSDVTEMQSYLINAREHLLMIMDRVSNECRTKAVEPKMYLYIIYTYLANNIIINILFEWPGLCS